MEFLNYRAIKAKLKRRGILFKKPSLEDASNQFYTLARQLDDHKSYAGLCYLAITNCQGTDSQVGALLNAARSFSKAGYEIVSSEDHVRAVIWIYTEALVNCDRSFIKPICLEMGRFYESRGMYEQAADCFKQSMSISRCVYNLILSKRHRSALDELKNCPSHLMTPQDYTSMFLLELLLKEDVSELNLTTLQQLSTSSKPGPNGGSFPIDEDLYDLKGLLESLMIFVQKERQSMLESGGNSSGSKNVKIKDSIVNKLSAFLDPVQIQILFLITDEAETRSAEVI